MFRSLKSEAELLLPSTHEVPCGLQERILAMSPKSQTLCPLYTLETSNYCPFTSLIPLKESYGKDKFLVRFKAEMRVY